MLLDSGAAEAHALKSLGVAHVTDSLESPVAIAAALRRVGSALSPAAPREFVAAVMEALGPLISDESALTELVESTLDELAAYGDFLEAPREVGLAGRQLYRAAPSFVRHGSNVLLFGLRNLDQPLLPEHLMRRVTLDGHRRRLASVTEGEVQELRDHDLVELTAAQWLKSPRLSSASTVTSEAVAALERQPATSFSEGVQILEPTRPVTYYKGRWTGLTPRHSGKFVGRRQQAFGTDLWCFLDVFRGVVTRFLDLPQEHTQQHRACDDAWRLQAAIDAVQGSPQVFRLVPLGGRTTAMQLFSPMPSWVQRRWDAVGRPLPKAPGYLLAYEFANSDIEVERAFVTQHLWMQERRDEGEKA